MYELEEKVNEEQNVHNFVDRYRRRIHTLLNWGKNWFFVKKNKKSKQTEIKTMEAFIQVYI